MSDSSDQAQQGAKPTLRRSTAVWLVGFNYAQAGLGFIVSLWLARQLGDAVYGMLSYGIAVGGICTIVVGFASERTLVRDLVHCPDRPAMMTASVALRLTMAAAVIGCVTAWALTSPSMGAKKWPVILCGVWGALLSLSPRAWLDCQYKMHVNAAISFAEKCIYAISVFVLVTTGFAGNGATAAAACLCAARLVSLASEWTYAARTFQPTTGGVLKENIRFLVEQNGLILGAAVANLMMTHANQLVLEHQQGAKRLAYYAIAYQIILLVQLLQSQVVRLVAPNVAGLTAVGAPGAETQKRLLRYIFYSLIVTIAVVTPLAVLAPWIIGAVLPENFDASVAPLRILCLRALVFGPSLVINQFLLGFRLRRAYFLITLVSGTMALLLGQALLPPYGPSGVAAALAIAHGCSMLLQLSVVLATIRRRRRSDSVGSPVEETP